LIARRSWRCVRRRGRRLRAVHCVRLDVKPQVARLSTTRWPLDTLSDCCCGHEPTARSPDTLKTDGQLQRKCSRDAAAVKCSRALNVHYHSPSSSIHVLYPATTFLSFSSCPASVIPLSPCRWHKRGSTRCVSSHTSISSSIPTLSCITSFNIAHTYQRLLLWQYRCSSGCMLSYCITDTCALCAANQATSVPTYVPRTQTCITSFNIVETC